MVPHIAHEMAALAAAHAEYRQYPVALALEVFLLHVRNLRDFYFNDWDPRGPFADKEILAEHYTTSWPASKAAFTRDALSRTRRLLNARLAHISSLRTHKKYREDLAAAVPHLYNELLEARVSFLGTLQGQSTRWAFFQAAIAERERFFGHDSS